MRKILLTGLALITPLVFIGIEAQPQSGGAKPFTLILTAEKYAPLHFTLTGSASDQVDQFNSGKLNLRSSMKGVPVTQEFSKAAVQHGETLECEHSIMWSGFSSLELLEIRVGQRWIGRVLLGQSKICFDLASEFDEGGEPLIFQINFRARYAGKTYFYAEADTVSAAWNGAKYSPISTPMLTFEILD